MHIKPKIKLISLYVIVAWLLLGATFLFPQKYPASRLLGGPDILGYGMPVNFYYSSAGAQAQVSMGFLLVDLIVWIIIVAGTYFVYRNFIKELLKKSK